MLRVSMPKSSHCLCVCVCVCELFLSDHHVTVSVAYGYMLLTMLMGILGSKLT